MVTGWQTRSGAGEVFHLTRALYFATYYTEAMTLLEHINRNVFPSAWENSNPRQSSQSTSTLKVSNVRSDPGWIVDEVKLLSPSTSPHCDIGKILHTQLEEPHYDPTEDVRAPSTQTFHVVANSHPHDGSDCSSEEGSNCSAKVDSYHCAMLLHALVLAAVCAPHRVAAMHACISTWLPARYNDMWRQHNAEVRFANLILRLTPFPYQASNTDVAPTGSRGDGLHSGVSPRPSSHPDTLGVVDPLSVQPTPPRGGGTRLPCSKQWCDPIDADAGTSQPQLPSNAKALRLDAQTCESMPWDSNCHVDAPEKVYLLGESHTLPLAWARINLCPGKKSSGRRIRSGCHGTHSSIQLVPRLVIGLKAWHFNPGT